MLRIGRDLLDQQIIDVNGRKVVRVNDVTFEIRNAVANGNGHGGYNGNGRNCLYVLEVDVGIRSIVRRLLQGALPSRLLRKLQSAIPPNSIRWEFCNIVEPDPQRRLRLNISHEKLEKIHPADLADIVEELSPADREAIFETIKWVYCPAAAAFFMLCCSINSISFCRDEKRCMISFMRMPMLRMVSTWLRMVGGRSRASSKIKSELPRTEVRALFRLCRTSSM